MTSCHRPGSCLACPLRGAPLPLSLPCCAMLCRGSFSSPAGVAARGTGRVAAEATWWLRSRINPSPSLPLPHPLPTSIIHTSPPMAGAQAWPLAATSAEGLGDGSGGAGPGGAQLPLCGSSQLLPSATQPSDCPAASQNGRVVTAAAAAAAATTAAVVVYACAGFSLDIMLCLKASTQGRGVKAL